MGETVKNIEYSHVVAYQMMNMKEQTKLIL